MLEGEKRDEVQDEKITTLRVSFAKMLGVWAVVIILIQAGIALAIKVVAGG